jgi:hypothetical protein
MTDSELPQWAMVIKTWRERIYGSQPRMEAATNDVLIQTKISRIERGLVHPVNDLNSVEFFALLEAFEWSIEDFEHHTGLKAPAILKRWVSPPSPEQEGTNERVLFEARQLVGKLQTTLGQ